LTDARARVLQVVLSLNPGGTERLVVELARRLHPQIPSAVCCLDTRGSWADGLEADGIIVSALGRQPGFRPSVGFALARAAARHRASVIHAHHYSPFVYGAVARLRHPGLKLVFTEHGRLSDAAPSGKRRLVNRFLSVAPHRVFAVSSNLKEHLTGEGWHPADVGVIYNGIDVGPRPAPGARERTRSRLDLAEGTFVVGTIARLDPVKDLGILIDAIAALGRSLPVAAVVVGDGPERAALERRAAERGVGGRVRFLGQRDDAREWLAGCDAYVNSSVSEGVSLTILEAMAACLPVIATGVGGTPEVVTAECGRLIPARDAAALAAAIGDLARQPQLRAGLATAARARVESRFAIERMTGEYADVYRALAG
jgi:glycosyltransferase involved in cell wall biosynthesis